MPKLEDGKDLIKFLQQETQDDRLDQTTAEAEYWIELRRQKMKEAGKTELEINKSLEEERVKLQKRNKKKEFEAEKKSLENLAEFAATLEERNDAKKKLRLMAMQKSAADATGTALSGAVKTFNSLYDKITESASFYGNLIGQMETRLLGSGKSYASVADMLSKTFAVSPFFSMEQVMKKAAEAVEKGIAYNTESRAAMAVLSDKIATTFDAFDANLLRLIRLQQKDSTDARLGMENSLNKFFNTQFKDTSYLNGLSDQVSVALLEASATMGREMAVEFEYATQKWLGSMSSVGVSDQTIQALAKGIGYLGSGDITGLSSNKELEQLLVASSNRGGGRSYGEILSSGAEADDISSIMIGLTSLVKEIHASGDIVALNQYAKVFGLSMSDLTSVLNITSKDINSITNSLLSYNETLENLQKESSAGSLASRTSGQQMVENIFDNLIGAAGKEISKSTGGYIAWKLAGMVNEFLDGVETGVTFEPFGVGTNIDIKLGDLTKALTVAGGLASGLAGVWDGLNSSGLNLSALEKIDTVSRGGSGLSSIRQGTTSSESTFIGDTSMSAIYSSANADANKTSDKVLDQNLDEERKKVEQTQRSLESIDDNIAFMVQMMNTSGIVIRDQSAPSDTYFKDLANVGGVNR